MSRPKAKKLLQIGRWRLLRDKNGWLVKNDSGDTRWPSSLEAALKCLYEQIIVDARFSTDTQDSMKSLRDAIVQANRAFESLLSPPKVDEIEKILQGERR